VAWTGIPGSYAERVLLPRTARWPPPGLGAETGAALMLQGLTAHYLCTSTFPLAKGTPARPRGRGGVGLLLVQMAKRRGRASSGRSHRAKAALARDAAPTRSSSTGRWTSWRR